MKINRSSYLSTRRDAWVDVNLGKVEHNIFELKKFISTDKQILAVIKADAYGHGALMLAPTFIASGISMFFKLLHPSKQLSPITSTVSGIL